MILVKFAALPMMTATLSLQSSRCTGETRTDLNKRERNDASIGYSYVTSILPLQIYRVQRAPRLPNTVTIFERGVDARDTEFAVYLMVNKLNISSILQVFTNNN